MAINPSTVLASTALSNVANKGFEHSRDRMMDAVHGEQPDHGPVELELLVHLVANIEKAIHEARDETCPPVFRTKSVPADGQGTPYELKRGKYKHVSICVSANTQLFVQTDIGKLAFNVNKGFSPFDFPDGSRVTVNGANSATVIFYFGDETNTMAAV